MPRQSLKSASVLVVTAAMIGKGVGLLREIVVAHAFGTGVEYDAFLAAIVIPAAIYTMLDYGLPNILVPVYARHGVFGSGPRAIFWVWLFILTGLVMIAVVLLAGPLISLVVPGLPESLFQKAAGMLRVYSIVILLGLVCAAGRARLQGRKYFTRPAVGPVLLNIFVMSSVFFLADRMGAYAIVWGTVAGTLVLGLWYWWPIKEKTALPAPSTQEITGESLGRITLGVMAVVILGQMFFAIDRWWGSFLLPGSISALRYATTISNIPVFVVGTGLAAAIFPFLNEALASGDRARAPRILERAVRYLIWVGVPLAAIIGLYGEPLVALFLERGRFDADSTALTVRLLPFLVLGIIPYASTSIWEKVYYAQRWLTRLFVVMCVTFVCKFLLSWILVYQLEIDGLALATGLSYLCWGGLMFAGIHRRERPLFGPLLVYFLKVFLLTVGGGVVGHFLVAPMIPELGGSLLLGRVIHLVIGLLFVWGPLLLIDGRWGIYERKPVWEMLTKALGRVANLREGPGK